MIIKLALLLSVFFHSAQAFIPPLPSILKEIFDSRKGGIATEIYLKHRIELRPGEVVELEERILRERNETLFMWRQPGQTQVVGGRWEGQTYFFSKEKTMPIASQIFVNYLVSDSADAFQNTLTAEQFIRRDQLYQFKPGFMPSGEPQSWALRENYLRHDDIFLSRLPAGVAIAVQGFSEPTGSRTIFFDRGLKGIAKVEWKQGEQISQWEFEQLVSKPELGYLPRKLVFQRGGSVLIQSEMVGSRHVRDRQLFEFKNTWKQAMLKGYTASNTVDTALKSLLSYR